MRRQTMLSATALTVGLAAGCVAAREPSIDREASRASGEATSRSGSGDCGHGTAFHSVSLVPGFENEDVISARLSADERTVYLSKPQTPGVPSAFDFFEATRPSSSAPFSSTSPLAITTSTDDYWPSVSADGMSMFFESGTPPDGGAGAASRVWYATRPTSAAPFSVTVNAFFDGAGPNEVDSSPYLLPSAHVIYWTSIGRPGSTTSQDVWTAGVSPSGAISNAHRVAELSTGAAEYFPIATDDGLELFFARSMPTHDDAFVATRSSATTSWRPPAPLAGTAAINTTDSEWPSWISPDSCRLYFVRTKWLPGGHFESRLWVASRTPGEVAPYSDVTCTYQRQRIACPASCSASPSGAATANVPLKIHAVTDEYAIGGAGDDAYLAAGGVRHAIDLDAPGPFSSFWSSGSSFSLAGDPPTEEYVPDPGIPPELRTTLTGSISVTNGVATSVALRAVRWPPIVNCQACIKDTLECNGVGVAERAGAP